VNPSDEPAFDQQVVLTGARVRLRPFAEGDLDVLHAMLHEPVGRRLTGTIQEFTREDSDAWYRSRGQDPARLDLAIADLTSDRCIGEVALMDLEPPNRRCSFRIGLTAPDVYGRGFGTEATTLLLDHAFVDLGLHRIELEVFAFNGRARHVYDRLGFRGEGIKRDVLFLDGRFHDAIQMALLAPRWEGGRRSATRPAIEG
jgi:RimJ/RimL family protein N-acetyltransferase